MKKQKVKNYTLEKEEVEEKFKGFEGMKIDEDLSQIRCDMGFWCQVIKVIQEGEFVERAKREMKILIDRLQKERGWTLDKIYKRIITFIKVDDDVKQVYNY